MCKRDKHPLIGTCTLLVRTAGSPGFPVEFGGVGELNAAFLEESRTRGGGRVPRSRKSGSPGGLVAATDRIGAGSHRRCPSKCHNHSHQHRYRPDQTNYVQQRGHLYLRLGAETQGLAILCRSGFKRPCLRQCDTQVVMNGRVVGRAHLQLAPQYFRFVEPACLHELHGLPRKTILPMQWDGCSQQYQQKPPQASNPQPQERDIHQRLHAYRIITEADRDWKEGSRCVSVIVNCVNGRWGKEFQPALKRVMRVGTLSRSAKAPLPPHKCGGFHVRTFH
jgi:hypothetical protein